MRQTDYDGKSETFKAVVVQNKGRGVVTVFPNPSTSSSTVHIAADQPLDFASVTVQDLTGKTIPSSAMMNENGTIDLRIDDSYMQKGAVYFISVSDGSSIIREKLFIN
ncbi:MAG: T9SS type A sorting domain-containing protein [Bacteroidia bacterium]